LREESSGVNEKQHMAHILRKNMGGVRKEVKRVEGRGLRRGGAYVNPHTNNAVITEVRYTV
jgi:hypothetical protein